MVTHTKKTRVPDRGDLVWLSFDPRAGHEQAGRRPALVLSPRAYNAAVGLALCCPITSQVKHYSFEVALPAKSPITGVVLADHVKSLDWQARGAEYIATVPEPVIADVLAKLATLIKEE